MSNPTTPFSWQMPTATDLVTDLPADFAVFGQAVATSMADLLGGTTGQILAKASATDMDFAWIANDQGDITGVTATSPLTGGGTSGAITVGIQDALTTQKGAVQLSDSTSTTSSILAATPTAVKSAYDLANAAIAKSLTTTTGDTIYASAANTPARLGIGTAGQVLTVASGIPSWATPAAGGGLTLLSTTTLTGASVTISSISQSYKNLYISIYNVNLVSQGQIRLGLNATQSVVIGGAYGDGVTNGTFGDGTDYITALNLGAATVTNGFVYEITNYADTQYHAVSCTGGFANAGTWTGQSLAGVHKSTTAVTSIKLTPGTGNFTAGTVKIYGAN